MRRGATVAIGDAIVSASRTIRGLLFRVGCRALPPSPWLYEKWSPQDWQIWKQSHTKLRPSAAFGPGRHPPRNARVDTFPTFFPLLERSPQVLIVLPNWGALFVGHGGGHTCIASQQVRETCVCRRKCDRTRGAVRIVCPGFGCFSGPPLVLVKSVCVAVILETVSGGDAFERSEHDDRCEMSG